VKKCAFVLLLAILSTVLITACTPEPISAISARDFDTRLSNLSTSLNAHELSEISTMIINAHRDDFSDISGWFNDTDIIDRDVLRKNIILDSRFSTVTLSLNNSNRVSRVNYIFDIVDLEHFVGYIAYDIHFADSRVITRSIDGSDVVEISEEELLDALEDALVENGNLSFTARYRFTNSNGDNARFSFGFSMRHTAVGLIFFESKDFTLDLFS